MIGSLQSMWKKALKKVDQVSWKSIVITLTTIMILSAIFSFINTQNPQTSKERNLKMWGSAPHLPPALPVTQPMNPLLQQMWQTPPMLPSMTLQQQCQQMVQSPQMFPLMPEQLRQCQQMLSLQRQITQMMQQQCGFASPPMLPSMQAVPPPSTAISMPAGQLPQAPAIFPAESDKDDDEDSGEQSVPSLVDGDVDSGESTRSSPPPAAPMPLKEAQFNVTLSTKFKFKKRNLELSVEMDKSLSLVNAWLVGKLADPVFARVDRHHMRVGNRGGDRWKEANIIRKIKRKLESVLESKYECTLLRNVYERESGTGRFDFECKKI